jgi:hypothetical protein
MATTPAAGPSRRQIQNQLRDELENHKAIQDALSEEAKWYKSIGDMETARAKESEKIAERQRMINDLLANQNKLSDPQKAALKKLVDLQKEQIKNEKEVNAQLEKQQNCRKNLVNTISETNKQIGAGIKFLMDQDKIIKTTVLNLGMSGAKAAELRQTFEQSAGFAAKLGGSLEDVGTIMTGYADETGRARALSSEMVDDIMKIGKGTGLGVEQATKLGAQFELMGFDAKNTMNYVQGIVDTSERMGVNTIKVLKNLNDNFKKLNTYTFQRGSKAMAEMAMNSEKMKVSMDSALKVADMGDSLEKVIELTANLQVMGGEFAKVDPMQMFYQMRNEPEKVMEKISEMTKGIATFRKQADGTFEKFISPADKQRLASVAESLGIISKEEIFETTKRRLDLDKMNQDLAGLGLSDREKELVKGAAIFNKNTMGYEVKLAGHMHDISTLTKEQANSFMKESKSLEDRAIDSQTFEDALKNTLLEIKSGLLPILETVNTVLTWTRANVLEPLTALFKSVGPWITGAGLITAAVAWKAVTAGLNHTIEKWVSGGMGMGKSKGGGGLSSLGKQREGIGQGAAMAGKGKMLAGAGAGVGAAALGIGAGIGTAAAGISLLANSMSKLDDKQAKVLRDIVLTLGISIGVTSLAAVGILAFSTAAGASAGPLIAFGAGVALIGAGIGLAAAGIGVLGFGLGDLVKNSKGAGKDMMEVGLGIAEIGAALAIAGVGGWVGLAVLGSTLGIIALTANKVSKVGEAFANIKAVMSGSREDFMAVADAVERISKANFKGGSGLSELTNLLKNPLKVEFSDKQVAVVSNITMNIDGYKFHEATQTGAYIRNDSYESKRGYKGKG